MGCYTQFRCCGTHQSNGEIEKKISKKLKKLLTKRKTYDNINKLSLRNDNKEKRKFSRLNEAQQIERSSMDCAELNLVP